MEVLKGLLSIEGIDGSGKSTFLNLFKENFNSRDMSVIRYDTAPFTKEGTAYIRSLLSNKTAIPKPVKNIALLFAFISDFLIHENDISNLFFKDHYLGHPLVVTDRYILSTIAYQSLYIEFDKVIEIIKSSEVKIPEFIVYLDCTPKVACKRILERAKKENKEIEMFEEEELLTKIHENYEKALKWVELNTSATIIRCDTTKSIEECKEYYIPLLVDVIETQYMGYCTTKKEKETEGKRVDLILSMDPKDHTKSLKVIVNPN